MTDHARGRILADRDGEIGWIVFNQPDKHNALSLDMWGDLAAALDRWTKDDAIRAVVLTGAGDRAFVSGADISQFAELRASAEAQRRYEQSSMAGRAALASFPKPMVAAINGYCIGAGMTVALHADLRLAARHAQFAIPAARLGLAYDFASIERLAAVIGPGAASRMLLTAQRLDAVEAHRIGLVEQLVDAADLRRAAGELAQQIAANAPLSVRAMKAALREAGLPPDQRDAGRLDQLISACFDSADYREGRAAFAEKRAPRFTGR